MTHPFITSLTMILLVAACGGSSSTENPPEDGGVSAECNVLADPARRVVEERVAGDAPAPQGGSIEDGDYVATSATLYTGPGGTTTPGDTLAVVLRVAGASFQLVRDGERRSATVSARGPVLSVTTTCPPGSRVDETGYTASAGGLEVQNRRSNGTRVIRFTRQ